jgi:hypothetical protein
VDDQISQDPVQCESQVEHLWVRESKMIDRTFHDESPIMQSVELIVKAQIWQRFSSVGLFTLLQFVNRSFWMENYVNSRFASSAIPFLSYILGDSDFILLSLTAGLTKISSGFPVILFAVAIDSSHLLVKAEDAKGH